MCFNPLEYVGSILSFVIHCMTHVCSDTVNLYANDKVRVHSITTSTTTTSNWPRIISELGWSPKMNFSELLVQDFLQTTCFSCHQSKNINKNRK